MKGIFVTYLAKIDFVPTFKVIKVSENLVSSARLKAIAEFRYNVVQNPTVDARCWSKELVIVLKRLELEKCPNLEDIREIFTTYDKLSEEFTTVGKSRHWKYPYWRVNIEETVTSH